jgi:hypothetical protein
VRRSGLLDEDVGGDLEKRLSRRNESAQRHLSEPNHVVRLENIPSDTVAIFSNMALHSSPIKSNDVRLPEPQPGEALMVERYSAKHVKAVILHPDDFAELQGSSELLDDLTASSELSDLGVRAHQMAESPEGELIDNEASVRRLLGL